MTEESDPVLNEPMAGVETAAVLDHLELYRLGLAEALSRVDVSVVASGATGATVLKAVADNAVDLLIVGRTADARPQEVLREAKRARTQTKVMLLLDRAEDYDVARLVSLGADGLLLRSAKAADVESAIDHFRKDERFVASAFTAGALGRVGLNVHVEPEDAMNRSGLSRKELEVLAELATGATYKEIASTLIVTHATVKTHLVHIYAKLQVRNRQEAVARGLALGLLS